MKIIVLTYECFLYRFYEIKAKFFLPCSIRCFLPPQFKCKTYEYYRPGSYQSFEQIR